MQNVRVVQKWLSESGLSAVVIPSTDEFLNEFPPPANRELAWATGFTGSTGVAVITRDSAALFLDGRYLLQGRQETYGSHIEICPNKVPARRSWLYKNLTSGSRLALESGKHPPHDVQTWRQLAAAVGSELVLIDTGPANDLWNDDRPTQHAPKILDYPLQYAGAPHLEKCQRLREHLKSNGYAALLVADPEDVSWLLNVRAHESALQTKVGEWHVVPVSSSRVLLPAEGPVQWFVDTEQLAPDVLARADGIEILPPDALAAQLGKQARAAAVALDLRQTPVALTSVVEQVGRVVDDNIVARSRWRKHPNEIEGARRAHIADAIAVIKFMAWLARTVPREPVSELDAARKLEAFRRENPAYKGPSMPLMSASGPNGSLPHYVPSSRTDRLLNDHPLYWMDSGGQYLGGTTDNTIALAVKEPEPKHIAAHTTVLKGYIALATATVPVGIYGFALEVFARQPLWREGMDYATGTGHGVGNFMNIHEGPYLSREPSPLTTAPIEADMILSNEPGYYAVDDFGLRIESHMVSVPARFPGFLQFETVSRFPIDPQLVDFSRLAPAEKRWLADYHRAVWKDVGPHLDGPAFVWLRQLVAKYE
jgi:Xaa-Pro aminopeptidase